MMPNKRWPILSSKIQMGVAAPSKAVSVVLLVCLTLCFGSTYIFSIMAMQGMGPVAAGASRIIVGSLFLFVVVVLSGHGLVKTRVQWRAVSIYGLAFLAFPYLSIPWLLQYLSTATVAIYYAAIPLFVLLLSWLFLGTFISYRKWCGFMIGAAGLVVLAGVGSDAGVAANGSVESSLELGFSILPHIVCILGAFSLAAGGVYVQSMPPMSPLSMTSSAFLVANLVAVPVFFMDLPTAMPTVFAVAGVVGGGCIAAGLGTLIRGILIRREGAIFTSINGYMVPLYASLLGTVFLSETISGGNMLAYALVVTGLLIARK